ncbi:MAG TPA: DUF2182 domain-containing protein, partial [Rhizomicrobium sp.]|nr:DUF2182 domain-containing protein [Rhizomicrobium sp.]
MRLAWKIASEDAPAAAALALLAIAAWFCFIWMNAAGAMPGMAMPAGLGGGFAMWEIMAVAMMTPMLALPVFASENRGAAFTFVFAGGYFSVWSAFALLAAIVERELDGFG